MRVIFHKFDPLTPAPGGIDTCIRGILKYHQKEEIRVVGVDGLASADRSLGVWEQHQVGGRTIYFMAVTRLDPGNQVRVVPHSMRIAIGAVRYWRRFPRAEWVQSHRADLGALARILRPRSKHAYFIHTQESGILGKDSDSFWRKAASIHQRLEQRVVRRAEVVRVFNPSYAPLVASWNSRTKASPTWWDPELVKAGSRERTSRTDLLWVGRLEQPKVPLMAVQVLADLVSRAPDRDWTLTVVGTGNLADEVKAEVDRLGVASRTSLVGRLPPQEVMKQMSRNSILLMTSVAGYEGFPRVLVEALAWGLSAVVTKGADTGGLVENGINGYRVDPSVAAMANAVLDALLLKEEDSSRSVAHLSAPRVIDDLYSTSNGSGVMS